VDRELKRERGKNIEYRITNPSTQLGAGTEYRSEERTGDREGRKHYQMEKRYAELRTPNAGPLEGEG
jgi:hypothetical protein